MVAEALGYLRPRPGGVYCDATLGGGGHTIELLQRSAPDGVVLGVDRDPHALAAASARLLPFGDRFRPIRGRFGDLAALLGAAGFPHVDGILADVGCSSAQIDQAARGFSFQRSGPIDMRMDPDQGETALQLIRRLDEDALAEILLVYGEERFSRRVARALKNAVNHDRLLDTITLAEVVRQVIPSREPGQHPATRTFQALRIAVNDELRELDRLLRAAPACLRPEGSLVLISFHSLEDRLVKLRLRDSARRDRTPDHPGLTILTGKPILPTAAEIANNPRARSARLRAATRLPEQTQTASTEARP